jgi:hypothetical protein
MNDDDLPTRPDVFDYLEEFVVFAVSVPTAAWFISWLKGWLPRVIEPPIAAAVHWLLG